ncbi:MAG TPA: DUF5655 domain-containing protein [Candidatus Paceibacterota bacterium]|nr:DUF5655 domain-containing protein [Candidatus Paceibacterota bacterium]
MATVPQFFKGFPESRKLFRVVRDYIESLGGVKIEVMRTQISFGTRRKFAWAWLPQKWATGRPKKSLVVSFVSTERLQDRRIAEATKVGERRWTHHVVLEESADFDARVKSWIRDAYKRAL